MCEPLGAARGLRLAQVDVDVLPILLGPPDPWQEMDLSEKAYQGQWGVVRRRSSTS